MRIISKILNMLKKLAEVTLKKLWQLISETLVDNIIWQLKSQFIVILIKSLITETNIRSKITIYCDFYLHTSFSFCKFA